MSAAVVDVHGEWLDGWNAALCAAAAVVFTSGVPADIADHLADRINQLLTD